jgi:hypothetical protein
MEEPPELIINICKLGLWGKKNTLKGPRPLSVTRWQRKRGIYLGDQAGRAFGHSVSGRHKKLRYAYKKYMF